MQGNTFYELAHLIPHQLYGGGTMMSPVLQRGKLYIRGVKYFAQVSTRKTQVIPNSLTWESKHAKQATSQGTYSLSGKKYTCVHETVKSQQKGMWDQ